MGTDEYRLERMNHYEGTAVTERTYNMVIDKNGNTIKELDSWLS